MMDPLADWTRRQQALEMAQRRERELRDWQEREAAMACRCRKPRQPDPAVKSREPPPDRTAFVRSEMGLEGEILHWLIKHMRRGL